MVRISTRPPTADQVAALDQLDAHRPGEQRVLEVGAVEDARGEHDDGRVVDARGRRGAQRGEQPLRVVARPAGSGASANASGSAAAIARRLVIT